LREEHRRYLRAWHEAHPLADTRLLSTVAAIEVAADACRAVGVPAPPAAWHNELTRALTTSIELADQSTNALDLIRADISMHPSQYMRRPVGTEQVSAEPVGGWRGIVGWEKDGWVGLYPPVLKKLLVDAGHRDVSTLLTQWTEAKALLPGTHGRQLEVRICNRTHRVYAFAADQVM
jgi:hypothetical protein